MPRHVHAALAEVVVVHDLATTAELILIRAVLTVAIAGGIAVTIVIMAVLMLGTWVTRRIRAGDAWACTPIKAIRSARIRHKRRREYDTVA